MKTFKGLHDKIEHYRNLETNWDGYGATAPSNKVCDYAHIFVDFMERHNMVVPTPMVSRHEVSFFYNNVRTDYMEMQVDEEDTESISYIICIKGETPFGDEFKIETPDKFLEDYKMFLSFFTI